jgi:hypothetical protein
MIEPGVARIQRHARAHTRHVHDNCICYFIKSLKGQYGLWKGRRQVESLYRIGVGLHLWAITSEGGECSFRDVIGLLPSLRLVRGVLVHQLYSFLRVRENGPENRRCNTSSALLTQTILRRLSRVRGLARLPRSLDHV